MGARAPRPDASRGEGPRWPDDLRRSPVRLGQGADRRCRGTGALDLSPCRRGSHPESSFYLAAGEAPAAPIDWAAVAEGFRVQKLQHGTTVKPETWEAHYLPVISAAVELLSSRKAPMNPADLMDQCIRSWPPGSRTRQIRAQSLAQFLRYGVHRAGVPALWAPPSDLKQHVGTKSREAASASQKGDPLTDQQILNLLAALPQDAAGVRWADAIRLMAELGLRPIELLHLTIRTDSSSREPYWWCAYRKRSGGGSTESRRLFPLPLIGEDGESISWNLLQRWQAKLIELPPLSGGNSPADCIKTYLNRQHAWRSLRETMTANAQARGALQLQAQLQPSRAPTRDRCRQHGPGHGSQPRSPLPLLSMGKCRGDDRCLPTSQCRCGHRPRNLSSAFAIHGTHRGVLLVELLDVPWG